MPPHARPMPQTHMDFLVRTAREPGLSREQADKVASHLSAYEQQLAAFLDLWASSFTTERLQQECLLVAPAGPLLQATCAALTALPQVGCGLLGWRGTAHTSALLLVAFVRRKAMACSTRFIDCHRLPPHCVQASQSDPLSLRQGAAFLARYLLSYAVAFGEASPDGVLDPAALLPPPSFDSDWRQQIIDSPMLTNSLPLEGMLTHSMPGIST